METDALGRAELVAQGLSVLVETDALGRAELVAQGLNVLVYAALRY